LDPRQDRHIEEAALVGGARRAALDQVASGMTHRPRRARLTILLLIAACGASTGTFAQELEPRAYSASPVGTNFLVVGVGRSTGDVLFDPTVPITDVHAALNAVTVGVGRTFGLAGRLVLVTTAVPYSWGTIEGTVAEQGRQITRSGLADLRAKLSVNLRGNPAMAPAEFARAPRRTIVGASLIVAAPTGQYDNQKLINLGSNRWSFKPEVGVSRPVGRWDLDAYAGVWLFTQNERFFPGEFVRRQDPILSLQAHASYTIRSRAWLALDATWYSGGEARVDDGPPSLRQSNARVGAALAWPIGRQHSVKVAYSTGASTRAGGDFNTVAVAWQFLWFD
jgi:hypothetical protein